MLLVMGNDYLQLQRYGDALKAFHGAVRLQPPSADLMMADYWLDATYNQIGQAEKALARSRASTILPLRKARAIRLTWACLGNSRTSPRWMYLW
jgi:tetratricopeptide (TPR) repeat protein